MSATTFEVVMNMIQTLANETSAGHDNIDYKVCKASTPVITEPLIDILCVS